jgi:hypothetical protein
MAKQEKSTVKPKITIIPGRGVAQTINYLLEDRDDLVQGLTVGDCSLAALNEVPFGGLEPPFRNVIDLAMTDPSGVAGRAAVQVSTTSRTLHAGDVLSLGLAVHHKNSVPLDLYVGLFPQNVISAVRQRIFCTIVIFIFLF